MLLACHAANPGAASGISPLALASTAASLSGPGRGSLVEPVQSKAQPVVSLNVGTLILAEPAAETPFPIQISSPTGLPQNSFVRIRGLPAAVALTEGHAIAAGAWAVPFVGLPTLRLTVPAGISGKSQITVALVTVDGTVLAEVETSVLIADASVIVPDKPQPQAKSVASIGPASATLQNDGAANASTGSTGPAQTAKPARSAAQQNALRYIAKGDEHLAAGDVSGARLFYQRAYDAELYEGALAMAASYDQVELDKLGVQGLTGDSRIARQWYERARDLGAPEAAERMKRLGGQGH